MDIGPPKDVINDQPEGLAAMDGGHRSRKDTDVLAGKRVSPPLSGSPAQRGR